MIRHGMAGKKRAYSDMFEGTGKHEVKWGLDGCLQMDVLIHRGYKLLLQQLNR